MPGLLQNHTAAITGAVSGIGSPSIALGFAREGARVVVLDLNADGAGAVANFLGV